MKPTPEQIDCIDKFSTRENLKINAYAGTGKTSTLIQIAHSTKRRGTFLAFNKTTAEDAKRRFPESVAASTTHSLAFRVVKAKYSFEKMTSSVNGGFLAHKLGLPSHIVGGIGLSPRKVGFLINETIKRFQNSDRPEMTKRDVAVVGVLATLDTPYIAQYRDWLFPKAQAAWELMKDPDSEIPLGHSGYLKLFALSKPTIPGDFIMLDEAQDTNGVVMGMMKEQQAQCSAVGDMHQQIYAWRGAENAMTQLPYRLEARLSTSFRFGPAIAANASRILSLLGETLPLKGNPEKDGGLTTIDRPRTILCRTNARVISELVKALDADLTPCIVGGTTEAMTWIDAAEKLMGGRPVEHPLELFGFNSWGDVQEAAKTEEGQDLRMWVSLIDKYGTGELRRLLEGLPKDEKRADIVLSTGHKAKGLEWDTVRLADDFLIGAHEEMPKDVSDEELRLYYVAATRAKKYIEIPERLHLKFEKVAKFRGVEIPPRVENTSSSPAPKKANKFTETLFA